ncbi:MAG: DegT/DnrJ/EryC1/StrS family aminotransferase [Candidatus Omnitrophica bacterium]|nr:DegT/DnrJ/EryC1/StrS family aminotransferase [Candidatus Omnitrophota bacterium]MDE2223120.1 DegT/DnrJ/EryC1/StrS family aminotransferase [Candidatus Omnitrophota bacterium]
MAEDKEIKEPDVGTVFGQEELEAIQRLLFSGTTLNRGKHVDLFEEEFAAYCGAKHAVAVSSCTAALRLAAQAARLREGDEVIVQANAFWNAVVPLVERKVKLHFADIDGYSLTIDPRHVKQILGRSKKIKAVLCFSQGGTPCRMEELRKICDEHQLTLIEDAAHASGASYNGRKVGSWADITCFSFSTLKNISTLGEGGMFVTNNPKFAEDARKLRECWPIGETVPAPKDHYGPYLKPEDPSFMKPGDAFSKDWLRLDEVGTNYKMSSIQAAVGRIQLKRLDHNVAHRASVAAQYDEFVTSLPGLKKVVPPPQAVCAHHLYSFFVLPRAGFDRNEFVGLLKSRYHIHITNRFWPLNLHSIFRMQGHGAGEAPVLERVWFKEQVSLPLVWDLQVVGRIIEAMASARQELLDSQKSKV